MANECTLWVNGMIYGGWTAIRINRGIEQLTGSFTLSVTEKWPGQAEARPIKKGDSAVVKIDGEAVCSGYMLYGTWLLHDIIWANASPVLQISTLWVYGVTYVAGPALTLIALANLVRLALGRVTDQELAEKHEDDPEELAARELEKVGRELAAAEEALRGKSGAKAGEKQ